MSRVKVNPSNDNENYSSFRNKVLVVTHVARNESEHLGYDSTLCSECLYDLKIEGGGDVNSSLYDYELIRV